MTTKFANDSLATQPQSRTDLRQMNRHLIAWATAFAVFAAAFWIAFVADANVFLLQACVLGTAVGTLWKLHQRERLIEAIRAAE